MSTSLLLIAVLTSTTTANPLSHQKRTSHLSKRLVYYGPSILGTLLAIGFVVFWLGLCIWYSEFPLSPFPFQSQN
jgi:hypothetical protein